MNELSFTTAKAWSSHIPHQLGTVGWKSRERVENVATEKGSPDYLFIIQLNLINKLKNITILSYTKADLKEFVHIYSIYKLLSDRWCYANFL